MGTPLLLKMKVLAMPVLQYIFPDMVARWAYDLWFTTVRYPEPQREAAMRKSAQMSKHDIAHHQIMLYEWGDANAPLVLLVHGWNGRATQLSSFVQPLLDSGFRVMAFDGPGHGRSSGDRSSLIEISDVLHELLIKNNHQVSAVIAHSGGAVSTAMLMNKLDVSTRLVFIGAPVHAQWLIDLLLKLLRLKISMSVRIVNLFKRDYGDDIIERVSLIHVLPTLQQSVMVVHDENDKEVPFSDMQELQQVCSHARYVVTQGLGHRRILRDSAVIQKICGFISGSLDGLK